MSLIVEPDAGRARLLVSFGGRDMRIGSIYKYEFFNFLKAHFPDTNRHFHLDRQNAMYHLGIRGETTSVDDTVRYLAEKIRGYEHVVFLGVSSGGYAAILFGSLLGVQAVLAFIPQTRLYEARPEYDERYIDLLPVLRPETRYVLVADATETGAFHHRSHCDRLASHPGVEVVEKERVSLRAMRADGELRRLLRGVLFPEKK